MTGPRVSTQVVVVAPCPRCGLEFAFVMPVAPGAVCTDCATLAAVGPLGARLAASTATYLAALLHARYALRTGRVAEAAAVLDATLAPAELDPPVAQKRRRQPTPDRRRWVP